MNDVVDRVARAIFDALAKQEGRTPPNLLGLGEFAEADDGKSILDGAYDLSDAARAAIAAYEAAKRSAALDQLALLDAPLISLETEQARIAALEEALKPFAEAAGL